MTFTAYLLSTQTATTGVSTSSAIWLRDYEQTTTAGLEPTTIAGLFFTGSAGTWIASMSVNHLNPLYSVDASYTISYYSV
jgi:hypothetical protein